MKTEENGGWTTEMDATLRERRVTKGLPWASVAPIGPFNAKKCQTRLKYLERLEAEGLIAPVRVSMTTSERAKARADTAGADDGIEWLLKKGRLTGRRHAAARFIRKAFRDGGGLSLRSCLDVGVGGAPGPGTYQEGAAIAHTQAKRDLHVIRTEVLWSQDDLITVTDAICGIGMTPRALVGGDGHRAATVEAVLMVALDLVARWLDMRARRDA